MILVDLNVLLDVVQKREPHYHASAAVLAEIVTGAVAAAVPVHAVTTLYYVIRRFQGRAKANEVVDWLLRYFHIAAVGREELLRARALDWGDFEDAVVAAAADTACCTAIITRNVKDFSASHVSILTPQEYLAHQET